MFGSTNPFGQSSNSPFGSQSVFGQTNNANTNPFAPKPFGSTTPFGSQTGSSLFGGTSTGVFGATQASPSLATTPTFGGASSSPAFGTATPTFGSTPSTFGSSVFGQKPNFGGFGSTPPTQSSPFGSSFPQTQSAFGSNAFGSSTPFGGSSQPAFGATSSPGFGAPSTPAFGSTASPTFGATTAPTFGSNQTAAFGSTSSAFGATSTPTFGAGGAFGGSSTPAFGATSTPTFGASTASAFGASSTPSFSFGTSSTFGQSASSFGSSTFGATPSAFGAQSSGFGATSTTPTFGSANFGQSTFGGQRGGSRVAAYTPTAEVDGATNAQTAGKLESISAMPAYKDKSHEELRWEDYQLGDKGGPNPTQATGAVGFGTPSGQSNPFGTTSTFGQSAPNPFSSSTGSNLFGQTTSSFGSAGFGSSSTSSPFGASTTTTPNPFGASSSQTTSLFGAPASTSAFGGSSSPSPFGGSTSSAFSSTPSIFGTGSSPATTSAFGSGLNFGNTQSAGLFQSSTPSLAQTNTGFGQTTSTFGQNTNPPFGQSNVFSTPSTGFGGNFFSGASTSSLLSSSNPMGFGQTNNSSSSPFQSAQPAQTAGAFSFGNFGQQQQAGGFGSTPSIFGQGTFGQSSANQSSSVVQQAPATNPFGTLPAMPQMSIARAGSAPSIQYGISSIPVADKPAPVRVSSLLTSRHLSQRRIRLPARKYHPKSDGQRVPFYCDDDEAPSTPKADALFIPRENPRALVIRPSDQWSSRANAEKSSPLKDACTPARENGQILGKELAPNFNGSVDQGTNKNPTENGHEKEQGHPAKFNQKPPNGVHENHSTQKVDSFITLTGHRAGEAAIVYEHGADIEALMPKLRHSDYYTEPRIQELAAKERAEPGFCRRVRDFVVGRNGYGSIKFLGETDVRRLDLESIVQFNNREVIVYLDESKKPPVGQGLNKPAEVTLLNIKFFDKKTGEQYMEGPKVERYTEMLTKKAQDQGAEFVSYEPSKGEWKFRVNHFSQYKLDDDDCDVNLDALAAISSC